MQLPVLVLVMTAAVAVTRGVVLGVAEVAASDRRSRRRWRRFCQPLRRHIGLVGVSLGVMERGLRASRDRAAGHSAGVKGTGDERETRTLELLV